VDQSGSWQTLQLHLKSACAAREADDITLSLQEVDGAVSIDREYLAARILRESLTARSQRRHRLSSSRFRPATSAGATTSGEHDRQICFARRARGAAESTIASVPREPRSSRSLGRTDRSFGQ
jgi:hypothetical protein